MLHAQTIQHTHHSAIYSDKRATDRFCLGRLTNGSSSEARDDREGFRRPGSCGMKLGQESGKRAKPIISADLPQQSVFMPVVSAGLAASRLPPPEDVFPAHLSQAADTLGETKPVRLENDGGYFPSQDLGNVRVAMSPVKTLQYGHFGFGPARTDLCPLGAGSCSGGRYSVGSGHIHLFNIRYGAADTITSSRKSRPCLPEPAILSLRARNARTPGKSIKNPGEFQLSNLLIS